MSFKVYNGVKFKTNSLYELKEQLLSIKKECIKAANDAINTTDIYNLTLMNKIEISEENIVNIWKTVSEEIRTCSPFAPLFNFSIIIYPYEDGTLYGVIFADGIKEFRDLIDKYCEDFYYWDNVDMPPDVSEEEWKHRMNVWNNIFSNSARYSDAGFSYEIVSYRDLSLRRIKEVLSEYLEKYNKKYE